MAAAAEWLVYYESANLQTESEGRKKQGSEALPGSEIEEKASFAGSATFRTLRPLLDSSVDRVDWRALWWLVVFLPTVGTRWLFTLAYILGCVVDWTCWLALDEDEDRRYATHNA